MLALNNPLFLSATLLYRPSFSAGVKTPFVKQVMLEHAREMRSSQAREENCIYSEKQYERLCFGK